MDILYNTVSSGQALIRQGHHPLDIASSGNKMRIDVPALLNRLRGPKGRRARSGRRRPCIRGIPGEAFPGRPGSRRPGTARRVLFPLPEGGRARSGRRRPCIRGIPGEAFPGRPGSRRPGTARRAGPLWEPASWSPHASAPIPRDPASSPGPGPPPLSCLPGPPG